MFIVCEGKVAEHPYVMPYTGRKVYSLEELCCYLYENIYSINREFFQASLADWLREETDHEALAKKITEEIAQSAGLKDLVVTILCGCDYYKEEEIRKLIAVMDGIANLPLHKRKKIKADNFLRAGMYGKSLLEYRKLLQGGLAMNFTAGEYGDILHNQGIAHFYTSSFARAEKDFKEAYARNGSRDTLRHYLYCLLLQKKDEAFGKDCVRYGVSSEEAQNVESHYKEACLSVQVTNTGAEVLEQYKEELRQSFAF